jgi:transposase
MDLRELKALEIAARSKITWDGSAWSVPSQSTGVAYRVTLQPKEACTCQDFELTQRACKHVIASRLVQERDYGGKAPAINTDVLPKKKSYGQVWPAYNLAQATEKHRLQILLRDLCREVDELPPPKTGRRPHLTRDAVFAMVLKVYTTFSSRRFTGDLRNAHVNGYVTKAIPGMKVCAFMESAELTPILQSLIVRTSLPLRAIETTFAPDSSGFSTSRFVRWHDEKYGLTRSGKDWVKVHAMCGVRTNIVTAVVIGDRDAGDSPQLPELLNQTARHFQVKEICADKAYLGKGNLEMIHDLGGTPFIPFKSNSIAGEAGSLWERMFLYYQLRREEFLGRYHQRSNAESTFSMVKAKFRDSVRSKTDVAMRNEVLAKFVAHNICVVHQSCIELGIEATFWPEKEAARPVILPMPLRAQLPS